MDSSQAQREKIAAAKKKLKRFQQKSARHDKNANGLQDNDASSQHSQQSDSTHQSETALHQQTIDILVEEKAELLKARDRQTALSQQQQDEISVLRSQLHTAQADLTASERKRSGLTTQNTAVQAELREKEEINSKLTSQVESLNEQMNVLQAELSTLASEREELNERLSNTTAPRQHQIQNNMSEVPSPFKRSEEVLRLEEGLRKMEEMLEQTKSSLVSKEMQCDALAGKISHQSTIFKDQLAGLEAALMEKDSECNRLMEELEKRVKASEKEKDVVKQPTEECAEAPSSSSVPSSSSSVSSDYAETAAEKVKLQTALEDQIMQTIALQKEFDKFKETHVDQQALLSEINNNKATISRAMGQNKQLKETMIELQEKLLSTSETNASLANEVQELSERNTDLLEKLRDTETALQAREPAQSPSEDSILEGVSRSARVQDLEEQVKSLKEKLHSLHQEKAILGLSAAQVDSVKAMNVALQEKVTELSGILSTGKSAKEVELEAKLEQLEKQYNSSAVDKRIQDILTSERLEREKQNEFLDKYYQGRLQEQVEVLEERIATQTKQFKQYITDMQVSHDDEVEALRSQLSELQRNFRSSLHTQYTQLVQYFTHKGASDLKAREEELHSHYMEELSRLYSEMTKQVQKETSEIRDRKRTQSDDLSVYMAEEKEEDVVEVQEWEQEKNTLQATLDQLEEEIVKIETAESGDEEEPEEELREQTKEERKLAAQIRVLQMQLSRAHAQQDSATLSYRQEIARQSQVIQKLHMYLATQSYDEMAKEATRDNDSASVTSAGQFERGDLSVTQEVVEEEKKEEKGAEKKSEEEKGAEKKSEEQKEAEKKSQEENIILENGFKSTEEEFEAKLKYLVSKSAEGGSEYVEHMQKLQEKFAMVMKDNANLQEKLKSIEHQNTILEGETDTIGEYISLYQNQRKALSLQFKQKDDFINKLLNERADMQAHCSKLQQLITELPCIEAETQPQNPTQRTRSDSISSNISTLSIMSTTRDEMLEIIGKLQLRSDMGHVTGPVAGPLYGANRGPVRNI